ncbi:hypothetical protein [Erythrobacter rubeus]|uniref:hypothetical protein n=1 Tax=Erythrobacter rubeus TaxID=2760803 RepID=UPI001F430478|nr:hypothetical protein [Erythrobacter rubeus]
MRSLDSFTGYAASITKIFRKNLSFVEIIASQKSAVAASYGGDISLKKKLLEKQKNGKAKMREYGNVSIPQEAFIAALRMGEE